MSARAKAENSGQLSGHIEMDEVYIGGRIRKFKGHGKGEYMKNNTIIFGMVERGGPLRGQVVADGRRDTLRPIILMNVEKGSTISTDGSSAYRRLQRFGYNHGALDHDENEWKRGVYCTNTIEGFWLHLKRGIKSTHASVSKKHMQKYVDEFAFRYNNRDAPAEMFERMIAHISKPILPLLLDAKHGVV